MKITDADRAIRSARLRAQNADPEFRAKLAAGRAASKLTPERRGQMRQVLAAVRANPIYETRRKRPRFIKMPEGAHPVVRGLFTQLNEQKTMLREVETRGGFGDGTVRDWRRANPTVPNLDAALGVIGYELAIVPIGSRDDNGFVKRRAYVRAGKSEGPVA